MQGVLAFFTRYLPMNTLRKKASASCRKRKRKRKCMQIRLKALNMCSSPQAHKSVICAFFFFKCLLV